MSVRSFVALAAAGLAAMLVQTTIFPSVPRLPVVPDLVLVLVVYLGLRHRGAGGACGAFLLGYFLDTFSGTMLGLNTFALTAVYVAVALLARNLWIDGGIPAMAVVFLAACAREAAIVGIAALAAARGPIWQHVARFGLVEAAAAAIVTPVVFAFVGWEKRLLGLA